MSHTPGPWKYSDFGHLSWLEGSDGSTVFHIDPDGNTMPSESDALLIAAAPDLLRIAKTAFHALKSYEHGNSSPDLASECAIELDREIKIAEGRS